METLYCMRTGESGVRYRDIKCACTRRVALHSVELDAANLPQQ